MERGRRVRGVMRRVSPRRAGGEGIPSPRLWVRALCLRAYSTMSTILRRGLRVRGLGMLSLMLCSLMATLCLGVWSHEGRNPSVLNLGICSSISMMIWKETRMLIRHLRVQDSGQTGCSAIGQCRRPPREMCAFLPMRCPRWARMICSACSRMPAVPGGGADESGHNSGLWMSGRERRKKLETVRGV